MRVQLTLPGTEKPGPPTPSWRDGVPVLEAPGVFLRDVEPSDAPPLVAIFDDFEVSRFLPSGPSTLNGFQDFIEWAVRVRQAGRYISLVAVPTAGDAPVGFFQIWPLQPDFAVAELGFALARSHWGKGLFSTCSRLVIDFAFSTLGVRRLEARGGRGRPQERGASDGWCRARDGDAEVLPLLGRRVSGSCDVVDHGRRAPRRIDTPGRRRVAADAGPFLSFAEVCLPAVALQPDAAAGDALTAGGRGVGRSGSPRSARGGSGRSPV